MKRLLAVSLIALASLILIPSALSTAPTIVRTPIDDTFVDDVDCDFPVLFHLVGTDLGIFFDNGREFHAFPNSRATLTNLVTQRTLTVSIAGPAHIRFGADGSLTGYAGGLDRKRFLLDLEQPSPDLSGRLF